VGLWYAGLFQRAGTYLNHIREYLVGYAAGPNKTDQVRALLCLQLSAFSLTIPAKCRIGMQQADGAPLVLLTGSAR
jgi:hypothetical protein